MNWCIIIPVIVGLICAILGYLLGRLLSGGKNKHLEKEWEKKYLSAENDLSHCKDKLSAATIEIKALTSLASKTATTPAEAIATKMKSTKTTAKPKPKVSKTATTKPTPKPKAKSAPKTVAPIAFDAALAKSAFGKRVKQDDLKVVEGIGPKIEQLFHNHKIKTWKALSECSVKKCQEVLKSGGSRYQMHNPGTWPKQAKLAYEGKWKKLSDWQDKLDHGK